MTGGKDTDSAAPELRGETANGLRSFLVVPAVGSEVGGVGDGAFCDLHGAGDSLLGGGICRREVLEWFTPEFVPVFLRVDELPESFAASVEA